MCQTGSSARAQKTFEDEVTDFALLFLTHIESVYGMANHSGRPVSLRIRASKRCLGVFISVF
jgi:hypothetical protein